MSILNPRVLRRAPLFLALFVSGAASWAQPSGVPGYERQAARVQRADAGRALGQAVGNNHGQVVAAALRAGGRDATAIAALRDAGVGAGRNGVSHRRFEQEVDGLPVHGAYAKAAFDRDGALVHLIDHLAAVPAQALAAPQVGALEALQAAMRRVHPGVSASFRSLGRSGRADAFDGGAFFFEPPTVSEVAVPHADGSMSRGWLVQTWTRRHNLLDHTLVAGDGSVLDVERRTANDSYKVYLNDPLKGGQVTVAGPGSTTESPAGWLGSGAQTTNNIVGNNVNTYLDTDKNNRADRGGTAVTNGTFAASSDLTASPSTTANKAVAVQNLFYLNNRIHDILYSHGFTEAAGNFQSDNFGRGGAGADAVLAEAQDGEGTDNANFATPPDGQKPRMQMFLWNPLATHDVIAGGVTHNAAGASFGPALTTTGLTAGLARTVPADGCSAIGAMSGKVALIDRGTCDFTTKVKNAQAAGAVAVVVANNNSARPDEIFAMGASGSTKTIKIAAVMVGYASGNTLKALAANTSTTLRKKAVTPPLRDAALDSDIVYHEYCHGLTWRMIGGMSGNFAGAIGEGMADGCALLINGDGPDGDRVGEYASSDAFGIRSAPYSTYTRHYGQLQLNNSVHYDGEVYAAIVWDLKQRFGSANRDALFSLLVDGMNYTPATPRYEHMRDGILAAAPAAGVNPCTVWQSFARFGVGVGASGATTPITASFAVPAGCPAP
jgi:hypothetical protein